MTTDVTHDQRISDLEAGAYRFGNQVDRLHRQTARTDLAVSAILAHLGIAAPTDDEVDAAVEA